jgi:Tfp pilus assembly protein PilF
MTKTFTQDDLIRYIYQDNNEQEKSDIEEALLIDNDLFEAYREIAEITEELNRIDLCPSEEVINKVLNYSKSLNLHSV